MRIIVLLGKCWVPYLGEIPHTVITSCINTASSTTAPIGSHSGSKALNHVLINKASTEGSWAGFVNCVLSELEILPKDSFDSFKQCGDECLQLLPEANREPSMQELLALARVLVGCC